jgi:hypothetical protein
VPLPRAGDDEPPGAAPPAQREVRHVAVVAVRLDGLRELEAGGRGAAAKRARSTRSAATLDDIAYKRGAVLSWDSDRTGGARHRRAAREPVARRVDAAMLAVDVHEALAGASEDLPRRCCAPPSASCAASRRASATTRGTS